MRKRQDKEFKVLKNQPPASAPLRRGKPAYAKEMLRRGKVGVLLTDTIYGVVGRALDKKAVQRIYRLKKRNPQKPFIILISSYADLGRFGITLSTEEKKFLAKQWPGPVSVILPVPNNKFAYLHRGTKSLAFRMPRPAKLRALIRKTGPLVAPSANPEGRPPAANIREAEKYFGSKVDFYLDSGRRKGKPSKLVRLSGNKLEILRC